MSRLILVFFLVVTFLGYSHSSNTAIKKKITAIIDYSEYLFEVNPSKGIDTLNHALSLAQRNHLLESEVAVLDKLAAVMLIEMNDFDQAMLYLNRVKQLGDSTKNSRFQILYEDKLGELYYYDEINHKKAFKQFERALKFSEASKTLYRRDNILCNYGIALDAKGEFKKALAVYREGLAISIQNKNNVLESAILTNIGVAYIYLKQMDSARYYLEKSLQVALQTPEKTDDVQRLIYLGLFSHDQGDELQALDYFDQAKLRLKWLRTFGEKAQLFKGISKVYASLGNFSKAYDNRLLELTYLDSSRIADLSRQSFAYDYKLRIEALETQQHLDEFQLKSEQERANLWLIISVLIGAASLVIVYLMVKRQRARKVLHQFQTENERLERERIQFELEANEREMASKSLYLLEKDNLVNRLSDKLKTTLPKASKEQQAVIQELINELKANLNNKRWDEFELRFERVNPRFFKALEHDFPDLSPNERKLCAFLSLNMASKEISSITGQSVHSITIARSRLRKKFHITNTDIDLITFLSKYS